MVAFTYSNQQSKQPFPTIVDISLNDVFVALFRPRITLIQSIYDSFSQLCTDTIRTPQKTEEWTSLEIQKEKKSKKSYLLWSFSLIRFSLSLPVILKVENFW
jgi:hypothetical protein